MFPPNLNKLNNSVKKWFSMDLNKVFTRTSVFDPKPYFQTPIFLKLFFQHKKVSQRIFEFIYFRKKVIFFCSKNKKRYTSSPTVLST